MVTCTDIVDLDNQISERSFNDLFIKFDTTYEFPNIVVSHLFNDEKILIDCMRWYNRIWPIRSSINMTLSTFTRDSNIISMNFNNIHQAFLDTKKKAQKKYILDNIPFYDKVRRMFYSFDISFCYPVCIFRPRYSIQYEVPMIFGSDPINSFDIRSIEFLKFTSFLMIYTMQSLIASVYHHLVKPKLSGIESYKYECDMNFNLLTNNDQFIKISEYSLENDITDMVVNLFYPKFFEG